MRKEDEPLSLASFGRERRTGKGRRKKEPLFSVPLFSRERQKRRGKKERKRFVRN